METSISFILGFKNCSELKKICFENLAQIFKIFKIFNFQNLAKILTFFEI